MLLLDLRAPLMMVTNVVETDASPMEMLHSLRDRSKAVMTIFNADLKRHRYCCVSFNPETNDMVFATAPSAEEAYQLAQAQYQRDTSPTGGTVQ